MSTYQKNVSLLYAVSGYLDKLLFDAWMMLMQIVIRDSRSLLSQKESECKRGNIGLNEHAKKR